MTRFLVLGLLTACIPASSSTTSSSTTPSPGPAPVAGEPAPAAPAPPSSGGSWFIAASSVAGGPVHAAPAHQDASGRWLNDKNEVEKGPYDIEASHLFRTEPATPANLKVQRPTIVSCNGAWWLVAPIEADATSIAIPNDNNQVCPARIPLSQVHVVVEFKSTND